MPPTIEPATPTRARPPRPLDTPIEQVSARAERLVEAQPAWSEIGWPERRAALERLHRVMTRTAPDWARLIRDEIGKPLIEAETEVTASLDLVRWCVRKAGPLLRDRRVGPLWQRWLLMRGATVHPRALGLIGMIGTWNYPLLLNVGPITQALAAGNTVLWKPSEYAAACGQFLHEQLAEAGLAPRHVDTVQGGPEVGQALIAAPLRKGVFTGGVQAGRQVLAALAARGIPGTAELSGFDAAVVFPDCSIEKTVPPLAWGAFVGSGQTCVSIKRIYVIGDPTPWAEALARYAADLKVGHAADASIDVGLLIHDQAGEKIARQVERSVAAGAQRLGEHGSEAAGEPSHFRPTVLLAGSAEAEQPLEGAFAPVVAVRGVADVEAAIAAVNGSVYGLSASLWGHDRKQLDQVARRLDVGMVTLNDAVTPAGHMTAPFGGVKASGFGRTRGAFGLEEFLQPQAIHWNRPGGVRPQLYPYAQSAKRLSWLLAMYRRLVHGTGR